MELVTSISEINTNIQTLDKYLDRKNDKEYSYELVECT